MKKIFLTLFLGTTFAMIFIPRSNVFAQADCGTDSAGNPIPCPTEEVQITKPPATRVPPTATSTQTSTFTPTATFTFTPTVTFTPTYTPTPTNTSTPTLTPTPTPPSVTSAVVPGTGIGALILFLIVGILFPILQKIKVANRGY